MPSANENVLGEGLLEALFMQLWAKDEDSCSAKILIFGAMRTRNDPASEVIACLTVPGSNPGDSVVEEYMDHRSLRWIVFTHLFF
jgi:hypothetical protein